LADDSKGAARFATSHKVSDLEIDSSVGHLDVACGSAVVDMNNVVQRALHIGLNHVIVRSLALRIVAE